MNINKCSQWVENMEVWRQQYVVSLIEVLVRLPIPRAETKPFTERLKVRHLAIVDLAERFFNSPGADIKMRQNFLKYYDASIDFLKWLPVFRAELEVRFPKKLPEGFMAPDLVDQIYQLVGKSGGEVN